MLIFRFWSLSCSILVSSKKTPHDWSKILVEHSPDFSYPGLGSYLGSVGSVLTIGLSINRSAGKISWKGKMRTRLTSPEVRAASGGGGTFKEFLGGDVSLGPWNP